MAEIYYRKDQAHAHRAKIYMPGYANVVVNVNIIIIVVASVVVVQR